MKSPCAHWTWIVFHVFHGILPQRTTTCHVTAFSRLVLDRWNLKNLLQPAAQASTASLANLLVWFTSVASQFCCRPCVRLGLEVEGPLSQPVRWCSQYRQTSSVCPLVTRLQLPYHPFHFLPLPIRHSGRQGWRSLSQQTQGRGGRDYTLNKWPVRHRGKTHSRPNARMISKLPINLRCNSLDVGRKWQEQNHEENMQTHRKAPVVQESTIPPCHQWVANNIFSFSHFMAGIMTTLRSKTGQPMKGQNCFSFLDAANLQLGFRSFSVMHVKLFLKKIDGLFETGLTVNLGGVSGVDMCMEVICRCSS